MCPYFERCRAFVDMLSIPSSSLNEKSNRCFCANCVNDTSATDSSVHPPLEDDSLRGYACIGRDVNAAILSQPNLSTAYHGTKVAALLSIVTSKVIVYEGYETASGDSISPLVV